MNKLSIAFEGTKTLRDLVLENNKCRFLRTFPLGTYIFDRELTQVFQYSDEELLQELLRTPRIGKKTAGELVAFIRMQRSFKRQIARNKSSAWVDAPTAKQS